MAGCCLFLAGKVEETPKKCKDIIRTVQSLLNAEAFLAFGEDPKEEVMTMERILLQTIKFDLQVEHPYGFMLNFAKQIKGDKDKIQKMAQMSWTFINDSLCTTLCLQWESEIIAVSLMYLASRLTKFDPQDWAGRVSGSKSKWWEDLIEGMSMELMEDICHQVLDLYSAQQQATREESPPMLTGPRPCRPQNTLESSDAAHAKRSRTESPRDPQQPESKQKKSGTKRERDESAPAKHDPVSSAPSSKSTSPASKSGSGSAAHTGVGQATNPVNPYVSSYSASFMSQEGSQSIQSLLGGNAGTTQPPPQYPNYPPPSTPSQYPPPTGHYTPGQYSVPPTSYPPPTAQYQTPPPFTGSYPSGYGGQQPVTYTSSVPPPNTATSTAYPPPPSPYGAPPPSMGQPYTYPGYPPPMNQPPPGGPPPPFPPPYGGPPPPGGFGAPPPMPPGGMAPQTPRGPRPPHHKGGNASNAQNPSSGLATVRITGRQNIR